MWRFTELDISLAFAIIIIQNRLERGKNKDVWQINQQIVKDFLFLISRLFKIIYRRQALFPLLYKSFPS